LAGWLAGCMGRRARPVIIYSLPLARDLCAHLVAYAPTASSKNRDAIAEGSEQILGRKEKSQNRCQKKLYELTFLALAESNICWSDLKKK